MLSARDAHEHMCLRLTLQALPLATLLVQMFGWYCSSQAKHILVCAALQQAAS